MLDDGEFERVISVRGTGKDGGLQGKIWTPVLAEYERITGVRETNPMAIYHHRISDYGPPCRFCDKPLRTPRAKLCGNCMRAVE